MQMIFSYLKVAFNIDIDKIHIYEDDSSSIDIEEMEERVMNLRDEALLKAVMLKDIYGLFRKGNKWFHSFNK